MAIQQHLIKADRRTLNSYDMMYNAVSGKPLFNQEDWVNSANNGTLDAYVQALFSSDRIDVDQYRKKYNLDYADSRTRLAALYTETGANRMNVDTKRKKTVEKPDGTVEEQEYLASDYEYNLSLIRQQNDYYQQIRQREIAQDMKDSMSAGDHIASFFAGATTSLISGVANGLDNLTALVGSVGETIVSRKGETLDQVTELLASDKYRPFSGLRQALLDFETNYTSMRDIDGNYITYGKYVGGVMTSIGEMLPSMMIGMGAGKIAGAAGATAKGASKVGSIVSQASFYSGMGAGNVQDMYKQFEESGADIDSAAILSNAAIKSTLQFAVEKALGKMLGTTSLDNMVFGRPMKAGVGKSLTGEGVKTIFKDVLQEGLEEVFQDTSDFLVDKAYEAFIKEFKGTSEISWQSLIDAFVIGGISSFAGSARNIITTKRVYAGDKKLNKIASWQYGLNMQSFAESLDVIDQATHHTDRRGVTGPAKFTLTDADKKAIETATVESYAAYRMITSIYNEIGEERFKAANDILTKITDKIKTGIFDISDVNEYTETIKSQLTGIATENIKKTVDKLGEKLKENGVTEITDKVKKTDDVKDQSKSKSKIKEVMEALELDEVAITDGDIFAHEYKVGFISKNKLGKSVGELLKSAATDSLIKSISDNFGKTVVFTNLTASFKAYYGREPKQDEMVLALFYDKNFFSSTLLDGNKDVYKFLSYFVKFGEQLKGVTTLERVQKVGVNTILRNWIESLTEYCCIHPQADPSLFLYAVTDSTKRKAIEDRIKRERWGGEVYNKIVNDVASLSNVDKAVLRNRLLYAYPKEQVDRLYNELLSNDLMTRKRVLSNLSRKYYDLFNFEYDGKTYLPDVSIPNRLFNKFLQDKGLKISNFLKESSLTESEALFIRDNGEINNESILNLRLSQFHQLNPGYDFQVDEQGQVGVFSEKQYVGYDLGINEYGSIVNFSNPEKRNVPVSYEKRNSYVYRLASESLNDMTRKYLTIDDLVLNPELLNKDTKRAVTEFMKATYGVSTLDSESVYLYIAHDLSTKNMGLVVLSDGSYGIANLKHLTYALKENVDVTKDSTISDVFKSEYIPSGLKLKFVKGSDAWFSGFKTIDGVYGLDNTLYIGEGLLNDKDYLKYALAHEFHHAIQFHNNMNTGFGRWTNRVDDKTLKTIINDVRAHMPQLFKGITPGSNFEVDVVERFVYMGSGESIAYGLINSPIQNYYPVLIHNTPYSQRVVLPWGTTIDIHARNLNVRKNVILDGIQKLQASSFYSKLAKLNGMMNLNALSMKRDVANRLAHNKINLDQTPAVVNYRKEFLKNVSNVLTKDILTTFNGNDRLRSIALDSLYLDIRYNSSIDKFMEEDLTFVTVDEGGNLPLQIGFVDSNAINLSTQVMSYINQRNLNFHKIKVRYGTIKTKDIYGYLNTSGFKQIFVPLDVATSDFSKVDSHLANSGVDYDVTVSWRDKEFWCARVNADTGEIEKTWTYEEALKLDFNLEYDADFGKNYVYFTVDLLQDNDKIEYDDYGEKFSDNLINKINKQITVAKIPTKEHIARWNNKYKDYLLELGIKEVNIPDFYARGRSMTSFGLTLAFDEYYDEILNQHLKDGLSLKDAENKADTKTAKAAKLLSELYDYVNTNFMDDNDIIGAFIERYDENKTELPVLNESSERTNHKVRPPHDNELREDDPRAKNFIKKEASTHHKYLARYLVTDDKGNQVFEKDGTPLYNYAWPEDKTKKRKVGQRKWKGTKLEPFTKRYNISQLSKEFQEFVLAAKDLDPALQDKIDGKLKGTLTEREVMSYLRSKDHIDDKTFKAINDAFFKNPYIDTLKELLEIARDRQDAWTLWRVAKRVPALREFLPQLEDKELSVQVFRDIVLNFNLEPEIDAKTGKVKKQRTPEKLYKDLSAEYMTYPSKKGDRALNVPEHYMRLGLMKHYDGSLKSLRDVASAARVASLSTKWNVTPQDSEWNKVFYDAYAEALEGVEDMSYENLIEALLSRKAGQLAKETDDLNIIRAELFKYGKEIREMTRSQLINLFKGADNLYKAALEGVLVDATGKMVVLDKVVKPTARTYVDRMKGAVRTMARHLDGDQRKAIIKQYPELFESDFTLNRNLYQNKLDSKTRNTKYVRYKDLSEVQSALEKILAVKDAVLSEHRSIKKELAIERKRNKENARQIKLLERAVKKDGKTPHVVQFVTDDDEVNVLATEKEMPLPLMKLLQVHYNRTAKTAVQNLSKEGDRHKKRVADDFYSNADEILLNLTQKDADDIIDFFVNGVISLNDATVQYQVAELLIMTYFIEIGRTGSVKLKGKKSINNNPNPVNFVISEDQLAKLEHLQQSRISRGSTIMSTWRHVLHQLDPIETIQQSIARRAGVAPTKEEIKLLLEAAQTGDGEVVEAAKKTVYKAMRARVIEKRSDTSKLSKSEKVDVWLDKLLQYERLAMLSGPGTWVRNATSNCLVMGSHWTADKMIPKLDGVLYKLFPKNKEITGQYKMVGTQIDDDVAAYIKVKLVDSKLLDISVSGINKYDTRKSVKKTDDATILTEMLSNAAASWASANTLVSKEGKTRFGKLTRKGVTKVESFLRTVISDDPWVKQATKKYLGKMITEDIAAGKITKEKFMPNDSISKEFLVYVAEAYKLASHDYMHRSNPLLAFESKLAAKNYKAYYAYKQIFPFAGAGWNWFMEGLNYTPIGLAKAIINFAKLESTVERMENARQTYKYNEVGPSSKFAEYIVKRNITKGVIGTIASIAGLLLGIFGAARLDEEDETYKLIVGDVAIDVSDVFGTQGIFIGMALGGGIKNQDRFADVCIAALDQCFMDSTFSDVFNTFRYNDSVGESVAYQLYAWPNMFIPNFLKTLSSLAEVHDVQFSAGIHGKIQKLCVNAIPGLSHTLPHYYDPYTGEKQLISKLSFLEKFTDKLTPLGISVYNVSDLERLAISYGINKTQLSGRYFINDESVELKGKAIEKLNMYYGKLNVDDFSELKSDRTKYKIQKADGTYKTVTWSKMSDKEKAAVVDRIMTNNSSYAKIYVLTDSNNYKYYASESEYRELRKLGITKNVFRASGKTKGFVKIK